MRAHVSEEDAKALRKKGISPTGPRSRTAIWAHVVGQKPSPYISSSKLDGDIENPHGFEIPGSKVLAPLWHPALHLIQDSLRALLESEDEAAAAIALDHYARRESLSRHGHDNPFSSMRRLVLSRARALLRSNQPQGRAHGASIEDATYASALGAMLNLAEGDDQALIADVMAKSRERIARIKARRDGFDRFLRAGC